MCVSHLPYPGQSKQSKEQETHDSANPDQKRQHGFSPSHLFWQMESPTELVRMVVHDLTHLWDGSADLATLLTPVSTCPLQKARGFLGAREGLSWKQKCHDDGS